MNLSQLSEKYLVMNLDKRFTPFGQGIDFTRIIFPSKFETHIRIDEKDVSGNHLLITCRIESSDDLITVFLANSAAKNLGFSSVELFIPYLPFARQDRVVIRGDSFSLEAMAGLVNAQAFSKVWMFDVHSKVALRLINNSYSFSNKRFACKVLPKTGTYCVIIPDKGAKNKSEELIKYLNVPDSIDFIECEKIRNPSTGRLEFVNVPEENFRRQDCYIIDDICDGGATFSMIAEELTKKNCGDIYLIVSHGIFSKGTDGLEKIKHIFTTDSFVRNSFPKLTKIPLSMEIL